MEEQEVGGDVQEAYSEAQEVGRVDWEGRRTNGAILLAVNNVGLLAATWIRHCRFPLNPSRYKMVY